MKPVETFIYDPVPVRVAFGYGTVETVGAEVARLSIARPLVICSPGRAALGERIAGLLAPARLRGRSRSGAVKARARLCDAALTGMPYEAFDRVKREIAETGADGIVAVGGGSPVGLLKAAAAATRLPAIAVVTSYSGSEMAANWYVGAGQDRTGGDSPDALPRTVIYDPELTLTLPPSMSAASGMNAMNHAVESLYGPDTNPVVQDLAEQAIRLLGHSLPRIVADPGDRAARREALYGAWHAAAFRATAGISHVVAQRMRTLFGLVHAQSHAVALPYAAAFNRDAAPQAMRRIERALGVADAARGFYDLNVRLGLATGYKALGVPADGLDKAAAVIAAMSYPNPRTPTAEDIKGLLGRAFDGAPPAN